MLSTNFVYCHDRFQMNLIQVINFLFTVMIGLINLIDVISQKLYTVPMIIQQSSINHFVDEIIGNRSEPLSCATSFYLLVSNDGCQTTWHQDFSATSVIYSRVRRFFSSWHRRKVMLSFFIKILAKRPTHS